MTKPNRPTESAPADIPFQLVLDALLDLEKPFHPRFLYQLSDLGPDELEALNKVWPNVDVKRRQDILEDIEELSETNYLLSFEEFCSYALNDSEARVRELAVQALSEYDTEQLVPAFLEMLTRDEDADVRAAAATALGKYIYLGEIEELPETTLNQIVDTLLQVHSSRETGLVRRRALESLGYSGRDEIQPLIEQAYISGKKDWLISALFAMSRSAYPKWTPLVLENFDHEDSEVLFEAVRAAGELEIKSAAARLLTLLDHDDDDVRSAAIWSLSQIGGEGVRETLEELYDETEDEEEAEFIEAALDNLAFTEDVELFSLLDVSEEEEEYLEEDEENDPLSDEEDED